MANIQFIIDNEKKMALMRKAVKMDIPMSVILRRLVEAYLSDPAVHQRINNFNTSKSWEREF